MGRSLKQEVMTTTRDWGNFTSIELIKALDGRGIQYNKKSLSALLATMVISGELRRAGKALRPGGGRHLVLYRRCFPIGNSEVRQNHTGTMNEIPAKKPQADSNDLNYADVGRAIVENVFEMRKMLKEQGEELARIKLELQERISQCKEVNNTISLRNKLIETLRQDLQRAKCYQDQANASSFN